MQSVQGRFSTFKATIFWNRNKEATVFFQWRTTSDDFICASRQVLGLCHRRWLPLSYSRMWVWFPSLVVSLWSHIWALVRSGSIWLLNREKMGQWTQRSELASWKPTIGLFELAEFLIWFGLAHLVVWIHTLRFVLAWSGVKTQEEGGEGEAVN